MVKRMFDQLRQAAAVQKEYRDAYGADTDAMIANDAAARRGAARPQPGGDDIPPGHGQE